MGRTVRPMDYERWLTNYWVGDRFIWQDDCKGPPLAIGDGLIMGTPEFPGAPRWRVVDVWASYDHHGHFDAGIHVFLRPVKDTTEDLPKQLAPDYFSDEDN